MGQVEENFLLENAGWEGKAGVQDEMVDSPFLLSIIIVSTFQSFSLLCHRLKLADHLSVVATYILILGSWKRNTL